MPKIDKNKSEEQRLAEIWRANDRTAAYRLRDLASSFKHLSPQAKEAIVDTVMEADAFAASDGDLFKHLAERIEKLWT